MKKILLYCLTLGIICLLPTTMVAQTTKPTSLSADQCLLKDGEVIVPNILGFTPDKAQKLAQICDLTWSYHPTPGTLSYEAIGTIGDQEPSGGTVAKAGTALRGFLSNGIWVPNLIGKSEAEATFLIRNQRFGLNVEHKRVPGILGTVYEQDPISGILFNSGIRPTIRIVSGFKLPTLVGLEYNVAKQVLLEENLLVADGGGDKSSGFQQTNICEAKNWFPVIKSATPDEGETVAEGTTVTLVTERRTISVVTEPPIGLTCP